MGEPLNDELMLKQIAKLITKEANIALQKLPDDKLFDLGDLEMEGVLVYYSCARRYDPTKLAFVSYFVHCFRCRLATIVDIEYRRADRTVQWVGEEEEPEDVLARNPTVARFHGRPGPDLAHLSFFQPLSEDAQQYLNAVLSGDHPDRDGRGFKLAVGRSINMSPFRVRRLRDEIMHKVILAG